MVVFNNGILLEKNAISTGRNHYCDVPDLSVTFGAVISLVQITIQVTCTISMIINLVVVGLIVGITLQHCN